MSLLHYALPACLLLFFVLKSFRQRVFLLGIPFLMYMGEAVFFPNAKIFYMPGRLLRIDHFMIWLILVWVLYFDLLLPVWRRARVRKSPFGPALSPPEEIVILAFAGLTILSIGMTWLRYGDVSSLITQSKGFVYLFVGYFLLRGMFCSASRQDTLDFIKALVVVNTIAAGLFVLHQGLRIPIYAETEYQTLTFMGQRITRSFYFMPQLLILAIAFVFAKRSWNVFWVGVLIVTFGALWVSYTRSLLTIAFVILATVLAVRLFKRAQAGLAIRRAVTVVAIGVAFVVVAFTALPVQSAYFMSRIGDTTQYGSPIGDANLQNRQDKMSRIYSWIKPEGPSIGRGFVSGGQDPRVGEVRLMSSDLVWVPLLFRLGIAGVVLAALLYATAAWRALRMTLTSDGDAEFLSLVLLGVIVGTFLEGFVSWTFLNPVRYPMGLWVFALLAAEAWRSRTEKASIETEAPTMKEMPRAIG
jgi:O-antigen ligase